MRWVWIPFILTTLFLLIFTAGCGEGTTPANTPSIAATAVPAVRNREPSRTQRAVPPTSGALEAAGKVSATGGAHLRKGPGTDYAVLGALPEGETVALLGRNKDGSWLWVRSGGGVKGWIYASLISAANGTKDRLPEVPVPAKEPGTAQAGKRHSAASPPPHKCQAGAVISWPGGGASLEGVVDFKGTANDPQFAYYKFEFRKAGDKDWRFLVRFDRPVTNGVLMQWHLDTVTSGKYEVRLIVVKKDGNFLKPCEVTVNVSGGRAENPNRGSNCLPSYPTVCIPPGQGDLNCSDIPYRNFKVLPPDPYGFDRDGDGIGCETK